MTGTDAVVASAAQAFAAGEHGDLRGMDQLSRDLAAASGPQAGAWSLALRALRWSFDPASAEPPEVADALPFVDQPDSVRRIVARLCGVMERIAICTLDTALLDLWTQLHTSLAPAGAPPDLTLWSVRLWRRYLSGDVAGQDVAARALFDEASRQKAAAQVIECAALRAWLALSAGAIDDTVELARRASRMAQAESLPHLEYLANLTLARVRRHSGRPHLALHILGALGRVAPAAWSGWLGWETLLGGGSPLDLPLGNRLRAAPAMVAEKCLATFLHAARTGQQARFDAAAAELERCTAFWPDLAREAQTLIAALDFLRPAPASSAAFFAGEQASIPCGLHGIGVPPETADEHDLATVFVVALPGSPGRRLLRPGIPFAPPAIALGRDTSDSNAGGVRTATGVAALALAGDAGMTRESFFQAVYGFRFVGHRHQAVLDMLCSRMRGLLGRAGEIHRDVDSNQTATIALRLTAPILVADMRCALPIADRVLRILAKLGTASASSAADSLRMPLRTVQAILQQLVADGACRIEREGRRISYRVEDTTFTEVTSV